MHWLKLPESNGEYVVLLILVLSCLMAWISQVNSDGKFRKLLFFCTIIGCVFTYIGANKSLTESQARAEVLEGYENGGNAYPLIKLGVTVDNFYYAFYIANYSKTYSLYDITVKMIPVSTPFLFIYGVAGGPQEMYNDLFLQPQALADINYTFNEKEPQLNAQNPELRYNFFITCRNGNFKEQVIVREYKKHRKIFVQVIKEGKGVIYTTPTDNHYLLAGEDELIFQDPDEGLAYGSAEEEEAKYRKRFNK